MPKTKVYARNKQFTGVRAGVTFVNGVGETEDKAALDWFKVREGYTLGKEETEPKKPSEPKKPEK